MTDFRQGILLSNRLFWTNSYPVVAKWFSRRAIPSNSSINCQVYRQCRLFHSNDRRMSDFFTVVDHVVIGDWKWTCIRKYLWVLQETTTERLDQRTCEASRSETEKKMDRKSESLEEWLWVMSYPILFSSPFFSILYLLFLALYCPSEDTASLLLSFHRQWSIIPSLLSVCSIIESISHWFSVTPFQSLSKQDYVLCFLGEELKEFCKRSSNCHPFILSPFLPFDPFFLSPHSFSGHWFLTLPVSLPISSGPPSSVEHQHRQGHHRLQTTESFSSRWEKEQWSCKTNDNESCLRISRVFVTSVSSANYLL